MYAMRESSLASGYDKRMMMTRAIPALSDVRDETDIPVWRGDHTFNSDAASYSLAHFIEPEVAKEHPDWNIKSVTNEASSRFIKRLSQDLSYEKKERLHEETVVRWKPVETTNGTVELATEYGDGVITLRELWEHTKEYAEFVGNTLAYNPEEERVQLAMQDEFIHGLSTGFVSVLSHPDSIRYVQVWEKASDGAVTSRQVDLFAATGRDFSRDESIDFIKSLALFHQDSVVEKQSNETTYAHFFVENTPVSEKHIRTIAASFAMRHEQGLPSLALPMHSATKEAPLQAPVMKAPVVLLGRFLHDHIEKKLRLIRGEERKDGRKEQKTVSFLGNLKEQILTASGRAMTETAAVKKHGTTRETEGLHPKEKNFLLNEDTTRTYLMKDVIAEWYISQSILQHVKDVSSGAGAALYWFAILEHDQKKADHGTAQAGAIVSERASGFPGRIQKIQQLWASTKRVWQQMIAPIRLFSVRGETRVSASTVLGQSVRTRQRLLLLTQEYARLIVSQARIKVQFVIRTRIADAALFFGRLRKQKSPEKTSRHVPNGENFERIIRNIRVAYVYWDIVIREHTASLLSATRTKKRQTERTAHEGPVVNDMRFVESGYPIWVLFAIIRYLVLLKESGARGSGAAPGQVRSKRKRHVHAKQWTIPVVNPVPAIRVIIFTIAS